MRTLYGDCHMVQLILELSDLCHQSRDGSFQCAHGFCLASLTGLYLFNLAALDVGLSFVHFPTKSEEGLMSRRILLTQLCNHLPEFL